MKKFIGAMIFGVIVVIFMVTQWTRDQRAEPAQAASGFTPSLEAQMHAENGQASSGNAETTARSMESFEVSDADSASAEVAAARTDDDETNTYVAPQPSSLAQVEAERDRIGRDVIFLDLVPYQLQFEPVDYQWFREMEQALYSVSYDVLERDGVRMVNLECATSVCIADFDVAPGAQLSSNTFFQASQDIDTLDRDALSMLFLTGNNGVVERIIFQRKE